MRTIDLFKKAQTTAPVDLPKYNPGEMILRLTPAAQVQPSKANPLGFRPEVLAFLNELRDYGLWRIEPLVQLGFQVWPMAVLGPAVDGPPPVVPLAIMPVAFMGTTMQELYRYLQFGDNASLRRDATPSGDRWIPAGPFVPPRLPNLPVPTQQEIRRRLMLRFDPDQLTEAMSQRITHLAQRRLLLGRRPPLMLDIERTPLRLIADQPYGDRPERDPVLLETLPGGDLGNNLIAAKVGQTLVDPEEVYPRGWHKSQVDYAAKAACMEELTATVAVLDSGADTKHPALDGVVTPGDPNYIVDNAGHGTHVCSILAGRAMSSQAPPVGMLPKGKLLVYKVMSNDLVKWGGRYYYPVDSVLYASALFDLRPKVAAKLLRVINLSLGGETPLSANEKADLDTLAALGAVIVAAAGNHPTKGDFTGVLYPAAYAATVSVGAYRLNLPNPNVATDGYPYEWEYSNYGGGKSQQVGSGRSSVDVFAPGRNIFAALPVTYGSLIPLLNQGYLTGTSMATPMVAAVVAAYLANNPDKGFAEVLVELKNTLDLKLYSAARLTLSSFAVCPPPTPAQ
ncbi:MAG: S8/S53 family peptidase [Bryobacteraceae bacterium]|nr:S8/S53 family peptidase [Bryobacteraceae bacterium]